MDTRTARNTFLDFFAARGHTIVPSSPLVSADPTLLFPNSGMVQFKPYFTGEKNPPYSRATTAQKVIRAGGKHNDLEEVGKTSRHFTFFEMLGNFSFGDYFKTEACSWAWELLIDGFGFDPARFLATIFVEDEEAADIWENRIGLSRDRIVPLTREQGNFWDMGVAGPCGPCSELLFDRGDGFGRTYEGSGEPDGERYVEVWNLVFMDKLQDAAGNVIGELPTRNIDTGMGFERLLMLLQGVPTIFDIDSMSKLIGAAGEILGRTYGEDPETDVSLRVMAEHSRAVTFLIADGVLPSNEARGYVLRRLIRRAARYAKKAGHEEAFLSHLCDMVVSTFSDAYPELERNHDLISKVVVREEAGFDATLRQGLTLLEAEIAQRKADGHKVIGGEALFKLHDTYGFPLEIAAEVADEEGMRVDREGFQEHMKVQRERARAARRSGDAGAPGERMLEEVLEGTGRTEFLGYEHRETESQVIALGMGIEGLGALTEGQAGMVILDRTVFYPEGGGQIGDRGEIRTEGGLFRVHDTGWGVPGVVVHHGRVEAGELRIGDAAYPAVDPVHRQGVHQSHTATHILHWALRTKLGEHARQQGSLVEPGRLRFDFSHYEGLGGDHLASLEEDLNDRVIADDPVRAFETTYDFAMESGAMALFGEKYGDVVRLVEVGDYSKELCGGTHAARTGNIGIVKIVHEGSVAAGVRRIEALTGLDGIRYLNEQANKLKRVAEALKTDTDKVLEKVETLQVSARSMEHEIAQHRTERLKRKVEEILNGDQVEVAEGISIVRVRADGETVEDLRQLATALRDSIGSGVLLIGSTQASSANVVVALTRDLVEKGLSSSQLVLEGARQLGGKGGGKPDLAVGGGPQKDRIDQALQSMREVVTEALVRL